MTAAQQTARGESEKDIYVHSQTVFASRRYHSLACAGVLAPAALGLVLFCGAKTVLRTVFAPQKEDFYAPKAQGMGSKHCLRMCLISVPGTFSEHELLRLRR